MKVMRKKGALQGIITKKKDVDIVSEERVEETRVNREKRESHL